MSNLLNMVLDIPVIFSILFCLINGWKKGAVRPFINFLGSVISTVISVFVSVPVSKQIYNVILRSFLFKRMYYSCFNRNVEDFPDYLMIILKLCKVNKSALEKIMYEKNPEPEILLLNIISPFIINCIRVVVGSILFFVIMIVIRKISKSLNLIFKAPVLSQFNSALGAFFGLIKGILISWVCILLLKISLVYWNNPPKIFSQNIIDSSFVFEKFYHFNPITNKFIDNISDVFELKQPLKWNRLNRTLE